MAEALELGHQFDVVAAAGLGQPLRSCAGDGPDGAAQLGVGFVIEIVIHFEDEHVDTGCGEGRQLVFELNQARVRGEAEQMEGAPGFGLFAGGGLQCGGKKEGEQKGNAGSLFHVKSSDNVRSAASMR